MPKGSPGVTHHEKSRTKILGITSKWRTLDNLSCGVSSDFYAPDIIELIYIPPYKDKFFLHQKYVKEGLSIKQISELIFSSKDAVRNGLLRFGIPIREAHQPHGRPSRPKFGKQIRKGVETAHLAEQRVVRAVLNMRAQGLSLRQIARFLTEIGVPTKCRGKSWHPEMVRRVIEFFEQRNSAAPLGQNQIEGSQSRHQTAQLTKPPAAVRG